MLIDNQTAAVQREVYLNRGSALVLTGVTTGATIPIEVYDGSAWVSMIISTATQALSVTNTFWVCPAEGKYRINKGVTTGAAGVKLFNS